MCNRGERYLQIMDHTYTVCGIRARDTQANDADDRVKSTHSAILQVSSGFGRCYCVMLTAVPLPLPAPSVLM